MANAFLPTYMLNGVAAHNFGVSTFSYVGYYKGVDATPYTYSCVNCDKVFMLSPRSVYNC
jgi:hypothetical protein